MFEIGGSSITDRPQRLSHVCYRTEGGWTVVDVWADEASFAAFGEVIGPVTAQAGLDAKPLVYSVQQLMDGPGRQPLAIADDAVTCEPEHLRQVAQR